MNARILVVDDQPYNRALLSAILKPRGHSVALAHDGASALQHLRQTDYDLVLLDVRMPGIDGIEVCRAAREDLGLRHLPIVIVTAVDDAECRIAGKRAGCDEFLTKPFNKAELLARVHSLLELKAYNDQRSKDARLLTDELAEIRRALLEVDRQANLGSLAASVGHELNNMAAVLSMGLTCLTEGEPINELLPELRTATRHVTRHARQLLELGRPKADQDETLDLGALAAATLKVLALSGRSRGIQMSAALPDAPVQVRINPIRMEQVVLNLLQNACDATAPEGKIRVTVYRKHGLACLEVQDWGAGISLADQSLVFRPYFTTKSPGKGTGLGLPVVAQIVESYGGIIQLESQLGEGTVVTISLPEWEGPAQPSR